MEKPGSTRCASWANRWASLLNPDQYKGHVGDVSQVIRLAITGRTNSPDLCSVMQILGEEVCQQRLAQAIELLSNR